MNENRNFEHPPNFYNASSVRAFFNSNEWLHYLLEHYPRESMVCSNCKELQTCADQLRPYSPGRVWICHKCVGETDPDGGVFKELLREAGL